MVSQTLDRKWTWLDSVFFYIRFLWVCYNGASGIIPLFSDASDRILLFIWFVLLLLVPYIYYRPGCIKISYYLTAEFLLTGSLFIYLMYQFHTIGVYYFLYLPILTIGFVCQLKPLVWVGPSLIVFMFMVGTWFIHIFNYSLVEQLVNLTIFYILGYSIGRVARINYKMKELIASIQEKNKTLEQYSERIEELTINEERHRVSQDLHDTVGHIFTSVITSLDALPFLIKSNKNEAETYIKEISNMARKGLDDVRHTIHQLAPHQENLSLTDSIKHLVYDFIKHTGTHTDLHIEGMEFDLGNRIKITLIRCLQESLTNAKRHGQAQNIAIKLTFNPDQLLLEISDDGIGSNQISLGFGLSSMKDRLASLHGNLVIQSSQGKGTKVICTIPIIKEKKITI
ncbi:sensor histidine kinase [Terrilactibacillus laevilacticus]|uniref:sensor histidine kinase n=1 Tax=Terrilactibacillus laevilacticus TaxID=1380157 RepID=UPI0015E85E46|nr:sensor histidine kinase [Terrilactibacillus laevilacticus]